MLMWWSFAVLNLLMAIGAIDGLYLHLWRFRLFARPESRFEHALHTARATLVPVTVWLLFVAPTLSLTAVIAVIVVDQVAMVWDVWIEPKSRASLGGLPRGEYLVHVLAVTVHAAALSLALVGRLRGELPPELPSLAWGGVIGSSLVAALHLALMHPRGARLLPAT